MKIKTKASIHINAPQEKVWEYITNAENFPKYFLGWGPIPGVEKIEIISDETTITEGMKQRVATTDGRVAEEQFLSVRKPEYFDYEVLSGFDFPFNFFVRKGGASWIILPDDTGNTVTWNYYFDLTSSLISPIGALLVKFFFKHAMAAALKRVKEQLEN
jgi:uncharacterized protein YndB with AHSA1/START domain